MIISGLAVFEMEVMRYLISLVIYIFVPLFAFSQGGNIIYQKNNRFAQNKGYSAVQDIWTYREDNIIKDQIFINNKNDKTIFNINVLTNKKADSYLAIFNVTQTAKTASEVNELTDLKINGFKTKLKSIGLTEQNIFIDIISLIPLYDYEVQEKLFSKTYTEVPAGFEMQKNIHIRFSDEKMIDKIMTAAAENEIYDFIKLEYFVKNTQSIYTEMRKAAVKEMKAKLTTFQELGFNYDTVYKVLSEKSAVVYPIDRYYKYQAYTATNIEPGKFDEATKLRKPVTRFYNMLPYHNFDIIINPEILEPSVQYTYSLIIKFINKNAPNENKKQYMLITPEGELKQVNIK